MLRRVGIVAPLVGLLLFWVGPASAALWLAFEPASAPPGRTVVGQTVGDGAARDSAGSEISAYLVPADRSEEASTTAGFVHPLGALEVDDHGDGTLRFQVPDTSPGAYMVYVDCPDCFGPEPFLPVGEFEVLEGPGGRADDSWLTRAWGMAGVAVAILAAVLLAGSRRQARKRPTDPSDSPHTSRS